MRVVWVVTGLIVLVCAAVLGARGCQAPHPGAATVTRRDELIRAMFARLADDPQARRTPTRRAVEAVVATMKANAKPSADAYYALGLLRKGHRDTPGAEKAFREAIALRPNWSLPYNGLGIALFDEGHRAEAEQMFHQASKLDPKSSRPHNDLAVLLRLAGRLKEAQHEALVALRLAPNNVATRNNYGNLLVAQGKLAAAEKEYRRAIELDPKHPAPHYNLACLNSRLHHKKAALAELKIALRLDPEFSAEAQRDPDFAWLATDPAFRALVAGHK